MISIPANGDVDGAANPARVVIVIYPGVTLLDAAGPAQVFSSANNKDGKPHRRRYELMLASPDGGPVATDTGIELSTVTLSEASDEPIDTLIIAGGDGVFDQVGQNDVTDWIAVKYDECRRVASTCMGAFLTAEAGLLEDRAVTTHWRHVDELQRRFPGTRVNCDPLFLREGKMWSSAGVTAGIDLALAMVADDHGHDAAMEVAQSLVVFLKRPGGQSQFSSVLNAQKGDADGTFSDLHAWIAGNLEQDLNVEQLAERAGMSPRSFARRYKQRTGVTPARAVERLRVDAAKRLLQQGNRSLAAIAVKAGLADEQRLRRAFLRQAGVSPYEYRLKFGPCSSA